MSIPNTPEGLRQAAEHATATGQPRLAALYTRKAEHLAEEERRAALTPQERTWEDLGRSLREISDTYRRFAEGLKRGWESDAR